MPKRVILGPQRPELNLGDAFALAGLPDSPVAVISAGWQEAEGDLDHVQKVVNRPLHELGLYQRAEQMFEQMPDFRATYRRRQQQLKLLQRLYRRRLRQLVLAARHTLAPDADPDVALPEQHHAIGQLRALDTHHLERVEAIHHSFDEALSSEVLEQFAAHREQIMALLEQCPTVLITGGHIAILVNRLRLFGLNEALAARHLVAWSAGAMALSHTVVLFHDRMPHGRREPEVLENGAGILPGLIFLPDASHRLRSKDQMRVGLLARRFDPVRAVTLDSGAMALFDDDNLVRVDNVRQIEPRGHLRKLRA